jgi:hypothetical protein
VVIGEVGLNHPAVAYMHVLQAVHVIAGAWIPVSHGVDRGFVARFVVFAGLANARLRLGEFSF